MAPLEAFLMWMTIIGYAVISCVIIFSFAFKKERFLVWVVPAVSVMFVTHTASILARYFVVGNLPWASDYETATAGSWFVVLFTLAITFRNRSLSAIGIGTIPFALLLLGFGVMRTPSLVPMTASLKSFWLGIHVFFAWLAFGSYAVVSGLGIIYLLKEPCPETPFYRRFPEMPIIDELMFKYLIFGFITDAVMIASGAIWAKSLWGNYWSWDPVETWSLVSWLIYGLAVHLRVTLGWRGRRFAWLLIFALTGVIISFFGINLFVKSSLHVFGATPGL